MLCIEYERLQKINDACDDEINYELYDKNHASGSAYYDLEILQSPILEAFTNNMSSMKSKLISLPRTNLLYLPVLMLQTKDNNTKMYDVGGATDTFLVAVDETSETKNLNTGKTVGGSDGGCGCGSGWVVGED